jgi:hypothetical protein
MKWQIFRDTSAQQTVRTSPPRGVYQLKNNHLGAKSSHTTRTFNLTCNHRCRIIHSTHGGPGRWNDQTMVRLDHHLRCTRWISPLR